MNAYVPVWAACLSCLFSLMVGLISWGIRNQVKALRTEMQLDLAKAELRFYERINGAYVKKESHKQQQEETARRLEELQVRLDAFNG